MLYRMQYPIKIGVTKDVKLDEKYQLIQIQKLKNSLYISKHIKELSNARNNIMLRILFGCNIDKCYF
jgi:hypothetical protein